MAPSIYTAKVTLTYPLYAADFDPYNNKRLVVGGGGGEGRSGIGNKIVCDYLRMLGAQLGGCLALTWLHYLSDHPRVNND
jgi:hypothetical protein